MKEHLEGMIRLCDEFTVMGASVLDEEFSTLMISSLPPSYQLLLSSITHAASITKSTIEPTDLM